MSRLQRSSVASSTDSEGDGDDEETEPVETPDDADDGDGDADGDDAQPYANVPPATQTFTVRHMRVLDWPAGRAIPQDKKTLLTLYSQLVDCQQNRDRDRFLIHCL